MGDYSLIMKHIAIVQSAKANTDAATEALDVALALASMDQPVQLILIDEAADCIRQPAKRYGMLEMLDAEPILLCNHDSQAQFDLAQSGLDMATLHPDSLAKHLTSFDEVLQFS